MDGQPSSDGVYALGLDGHERELFHIESGTMLQDVAADGRLLVNRYNNRWRMFEQRNHHAAEERSWMNGTLVNGVSRDGGAVSFTEWMGAGENDDGPLVYVRRGDALPVEIGRPHDSVLLADGSGVIAGLSETAPLQRYPVGPGSPVTLPRGEVARFDLSDLFSVSWDGRAFVFRGATETGSMRLWIQDLAGAAPRPFGPDAVESEVHPVSPEGAWVAIRALKVACV